MTKLHKPFLVVLMVMCALFLIPFCQWATATSTPTKALVTFFYDEKGQHIDPSEAPVYEINDPQELAKFASFFPQMGKGKKSYIAGGWMSGTDIKLYKADGTVISISVSVNDDYNVWSEGNGDWRVKGDLKTYLNKLRTGEMSPAPGFAPRLGVIGYFEALVSLIARILVGELYWPTSEGIKALWIGAVFCFAVIGALIWVDRRIISRGARQQRLAIVAFRSVSLVFAVPLLVITLRLLQVWSNSYDEGRGWTASVIPESQEMMFIAIDNGSVRLSWGWSNNVSDWWYGYRSHRRWPTAVAISATDGLVRFDHSKKGAWESVVFPLWVLPLLTAAIGLLLFRCWYRPWRRRGKGFPVIPGPQRSEQTSPPTT